jgi:hypothetical protein
MASATTPYRRERSEHGTDRGKHADRSQDDHDRAIGRGCCRGARKSDHPADAHQCSIGAGGREVEQLVAA